MNNGDLSASAVRAILAFTLALGLSSASLAGEGQWSIQLEPMYMDAYGHDQHVLTIHERDFDSGLQVENNTAVTLDTASGGAYRLELKYTKGHWGWGLDFFSFLTQQEAADRTAAADGPAGTIGQVGFEVADREFTSSGPGEVLFFGLLEDTAMALWTADLYGFRALTEKPKSGLHLQFGLRFGDFDNDYRAVVGIQGTAGRRMDASSNYPRMMGPLVGLAGEFRLGRNRIEGYLGQSVLLGEVELTGRSREFTGPFGDTPAYFDEAVLRNQHDVAIPITELRIKWTYGVSQHVALGLGAHTSTWWNVPVPPGIIPIENGDEILHENTIVLFGLLGAVEVTF